MNRKFYKLFRVITSLIVAGSLMIPSYVFGFTGGNNQTASNLSQPVVFEISLVKVVNVENKISVVVRSQAAGDSVPEIVSETVCNTQNGSKGLLQGTSGIKLQQPANCFVLIGAVESSNIEGLSVKPLVQSQTVVVRVQPAKIFAFSFLPFSPFAQSQAVIPITVSLALLAGLVIIRKIKTGNRKALFSISSKHRILSLSRLQVFRC